MNYPIRNTQEFGRAVRSTRKAKKMTQRELAEIAHVSSRWISQVESGKSHLRFTTVLTLLDALDVDLTLQPRGTPALDLDDLLGLENPRD